MRKPLMAACVLPLIAGSAPGGCSDARTPTDRSAVQSTGAPAPEPPVADSLSGVEFFEGWSDPRSLPFPVNTSGWEDSSFISPDDMALRGPGDVDLPIGVARKP